MKFSHLIMIVLTSLVLWASVFVGVAQASNEESGSGGGFCVILVAERDNYGNPTRWVLWCR